MNLRDLHYFVTLAKSNHFGEAAKLCFVSQPTLSMQIKKLEEELGVLLFERDNKRVFITDIGRQLLQRATVVLSEIADMKEAARAVSDPLSGVIRLGVIPTVAPYLLPLVMPTIQRDFPRLKIWIIEEKTNTLVEQLNAGILDAAIMAMPIEGHFLHQELYQEPFYLLCSLNNPLAKKTAVSLDDLQHQPIMLLAEGHCLREQTMAVCQLARADVSADFTATSLETLRLMVQAGYGVTLMPALALAAGLGDTLAVIPFKAPPSRTIALYARSSTARQACLIGLAKLIREMYDHRR